jgi:hypothetical protein
MPDPSTELPLTPIRGDSNPEVAPVSTEVAADIKAIDAKAPTVACGALAPPSFEPALNFRADAAKPVPVDPHKLAPASVEPAPVKKATPAEGTGDHRDTSQVDSLGNKKGAFLLGETEFHGERKGETPVFRDKDPVEAHDPLVGSGPRGANVPPEHLTEAQKAETEAAETKRLQQGMSSTHAVDSIGNAKGAFKVVPQGNDAFGNRKPDWVTDEVVEEHPPMVGPRGKDAP